MNRSALILSLAVASLPLFSSRAAIDLKQSKFTQVVNDVQVIGSDQNATPAEVDGIFKVPDILRTGPNSRAELTADDQTITRVGANTVFSFDPANRTIDLQKGSVLFHSPQGRGGGTVQTGSATASVLGTTIVVTTTPDGGFKVLVLEGTAEVKFLNGLSQQLSAGQMTFVLPGGGTSPVIVFRLDEQTKGSKLVNGFDHALDSQGKINDEIEKQLKLINRDKLKDTGLLVGNKGTSTGIQAVDASVLQNYFSSLTEFQPVAIDGGYLTIDGLFVKVDNENEPATDALFPAWALSVDITIKDAVLNPFHVFVSPVAGPFDIVALFNDGLTEFAHNPFGGFFGRNITITAPHIDMTPYAALGFFDFVAAQDLNINGSLSLDNADGQNLFFGSILASINIAPGSTISANANYLAFFSGGPMAFNSVTINNTGGALDFGSFVSMSMNGSSLTAAGFVHLFSQDQGLNLTGTTISAGKDVYILSESTGIGATPSIVIANSTLTANDGGMTVFGDGDVNLSGTSFHAPHGDLSLVGGTLTLNDNNLTAGNLVSPVPSGLAESPDPHTIGAFGQNGASYTGGTMTADTIMLSSAGDTLVDSVGLTANHLTMSAANNMTLNNMDLSSLTDVNISGHTVVLTDINFGGNPNITSASGNVAAGINTGAQVVRGDINMISGVSYNGTLLSDDNRSTYINPSEGSGIHTHASP